MSKRAEEAAKAIFKDGIELFGRRDKNNNLVIHPETMVGILRNAARRGYELAEKDIAKALLAKYKEEADKCPDADYDHDYTVAETQQYGRFMMMEDIYEEFCEPVGVTLDDLEDEL